MKNANIYLITLFMLMACTVQAQLTCTGCATGTPDPIIPVGGGTYSNPIVLTKNAVFSISGTGDFYLTGVISENGGSFGLTLKLYGAKLFLSAANTYTGATTVDSGQLGGTSSTVQSAAIITTGCILSGGMGAGKPGTITFKSLSLPRYYSGIHVYASGSTLSLIKVGEDGKGELKAGGGLFDIKDPITLPEGDYPIILAKTVAKPVSDFKIKRDNSGCCVSVIQTADGIYLRIRRAATITGDAAACPGGIVTLTASGLGITNSTPGEWTVEGNGLKLRQGETEITEATGNPASPAKSKTYFYMHDKNEGTATATFKLSACNLLSKYTFNVLSQPAPIVFIHPDANRGIDAGVDLEHNPGTINIGVEPVIAGTQFTWDVRQSKDNGELQVSKDGSTLKRPPNMAGISFSTTPQTEPIVFKVTATAGSAKELIIRVHAQLTSQGLTCNGIKTITIPVRATGGTDNMPGRLEKTFNESSSSSNQNKPLAAICNGSETEIKIGTAGDGNLYGWYRMDMADVKEEKVMRTEKKEATVIKERLIATGKQSENVFYYITSANVACEVSTVIPVVVYPVSAPEITKIPAKSSICSNSAVAIELATNLEPAEADKITYTWTVSENKVGATGESTGAKTMSAQTLINPEVTEESVTYSFTPYYTNGAAACVGKPATSEVLVKGTIKTGTITGGADAAVCLGDELPPLSISAVANETLKYRWMKDGAAIADANTASYKIPTTEISSGSYTVEVSSECETKKSEAKLLNVTADAYFVNQNVSASANPEGAGMVKFSYTGPAAVYSWDFNDNTPVSSLQNPDHKYDKAGTWTPVLTVVKSAAQPQCNKKFILSPIEITGIENKALTGDIESRRGISVYPVPAKDRVTISSRDELTGIMLSDASGRNLIYDEACGHEKNISLSTLLPGLYILNIISNGEVTRVKIIKE